jgi:hypothetical protein
MMSHQKNGLESALTDQALANSETNQKKAANTLPAQPINTKDSPYYILAPTSHTPSFEIWGYSQMTSRQFRRLAAKRLRKQAGVWP